jgi:hypothetical protein
MTPLFACFPVCLTFVSIAVIGVIVVVFGLSNGVPLDDAAAPAEARQPRALPPLWIFPVALLILTVVMFSLAWYWPE